MRRFRLTYHKNNKRWLVTDRYRQHNDPFYYQQFTFYESALAWIDINVVKKPAVE